MGMKKLFATAMATIILFLAMPVMPVSTAADASISSASAYFDRTNKQPISVTLNQGGYTLLNVYSDGTECEERELFYEVNDNVHTFGVVFLNKLSQGTHIITFDMDGGIDPILTIYVVPSLNYVYTIEYTDTYGCDNSANPESYVFNEGVGSFAPLSDREGYEFIGWSPSSISAYTIVNRVTARWREIPTVEDTSTPPHLIPGTPSNYPPAIPTVTTVYEENVNVDVNAYLNKQGGVNSAKTRLEVLKAARTKGVTQITLILPENCKGISTAAIQKCVKAAGDKKLFLKYNDKTIRLTDKSKQVLTEFYYSTK
jgi:hypothetical protein